MEGSEGYAECGKYLDSKEFYGNSMFKDKETVKSLVHRGNWRDKLYDGVTKSWGTRNIACIPQLLDSGVWWPRGIDRAWTVVFRTLLEKRISSKERLVSEQASALSDKRRKESISSSSSSSTVVLNAAQKEEIMRDRLRGAIQCTEHEVRSLVSLGLIEGVITESKKWDDLGNFNSLGPVNGLSACGRLQRFIRLRKLWGKNDHSSVELLNEIYAKGGPYIKKKKTIKKPTITSGRIAGTIKRHKIIDFTTKSREVATAGVVNDIGSSTTSSMSINKYAQTLPSNGLRPVLPKTNMCFACRSIISVQFLECFCRGLHSPWIMCNTCNMPVHPSQPCDHL